MYGILEVRQQLAGFVVLFFFLKQPQKVRRSWIRRGSQWHVLYPTASQDVEWADELDCLPGPRLI